MMLEHERQDQSLSEPRNEMSIFHSNNGQEPESKKSIPWRSNFSSSNQCPTTAGNNRKVESSSGILGGSIRCSRDHHQHNAGASLSTGNDDCNDVTSFQSCGSLHSTTSHHPIAENNDCNSGNRIRLSGYASAGCSGPASHIDYQQPAAVNVQNGGKNSIHLGSGNNDCNDVPSVRSGHSGSAHSSSSNYSSASHGTQLTQQLQALTEVEEPKLQVLAEAEE